MQNKMLTPRDRAQLANLVRGDLFRVLRQLADDLIEEWRKQTGSGTSEFEYLRTSLERDGKMLGVDLFLKEAERQGLYDSTTRKQSVS